MTRIFFIAGAVMSVATAGVVARADEIPAVKELREREGRIKDVAARSISAVVAITSENPTGTGSGVVVSREGLILTAAHVTEAITADGGAADGLTIIFPDGRQAKGVALGMNRTCDAAMVRITEPANQEWPHLEVGQSDVVGKGDWVVALGQPGGFDAGRTPPVRAGRVWARDNFGSFYTDCTLIGGDSGGPLLDLSGKVVGIHSSIGGPLSVNRHVAVANFREDWDRLLRGESWGELELARSEPDRPVIGVELDEQSTGGVKVIRVIAGAPAEKAGVQPDDVITHFSGRAVENYLGFVRLISRREAGEAVRFGIRRGSDEKVELEIALASLDEVRRQRATPPIFETPKPRWQLGVEVESSESGGAVVARVEDGSPAAQAGVRERDQIVQVDGADVADGLALADAIGKHSGQERIRLRIRRDGAEMELETRLVKK